MLKNEDNDVFLIENEIIPLMKNFIKDKEQMHVFSTTTIESWLTQLLRVALLGNNQYFNIGRYTTAILDDYEKCEFFIVNRNRKEILKFLSTLII
jgi:hypothetical protein